MNKIVSLLVVVVVAVLALGSVGVAYAQTATPSYGAGSGYMGGNGARGMGAGVAGTGTGLLHDYMVAGFAAALDIPVADLEASLANGETVAQVALSKGLTIDEFRTLAIEVRMQAIAQALADGVITQAQADWMTSRGFGQSGAARGMRGAGQGQFANPACPNFSQVNP
jgi:hypothetical protein